MLEKLKIKAIYDDFLMNVHLTKEQIKILDMLLDRNKIIKIAMEIGVSERTITTEIRKLKDLFEQYYKLQLFKTEMLLK
jgi:transcriptional antiterminator